MEISPRDARGWAVPSGPHTGFTRPDGYQGTNRGYSQSAEAANDRTGRDAPACAATLGANRPLEIIAPPPCARKVPAPRYAARGSPCLAIADASVATAVATRLSAFRRPMSPRRASSSLPKA